MAYAGLRLFCGSGICCGGGCVIGENALIDDLAFTGQTGDVTIESGTIVMVGIATVFFVPAPASKYDAVKLTVLATETAGEGVMELVIARASDDWRAFGRVTFAGGVGTLEVGVVQAGVATVQDDEIVADSGMDLAEQHQISLCFEPGALIPAGAHETTHPPTVLSVDPPAEWTNVDNMLVEDDTGAVYNFGIDKTGLVVASGFGFVVPLGSTIDGIRLKVRAKYLANLNFPLIPTIEVKARLSVNSIGVGDTKSLGFLDSGYLDMGAGGFADDWNAGVTDQNIKTLAVEITFECTDFDDFADVDYIDISINYTTPPRLNGTLRLSYDNSSVVSTECALSYGLVVRDEMGTGTGIMTSSGEWTFAAPYLLEYAQTPLRPDCPTCNCGAGTCNTIICNSATQPPNQMVIGEMTGILDHTAPFYEELQDLCGDDVICTIINGFFVVTRWGTGSCIWQYAKFLPCPNLPGHGDPNFPGYRAVFIQVYFTLDELGNTCWGADVVVSFNWPGATLGPIFGDDVGGSEVWKYRSNPIVDTVCTLPVNLIFLAHVFDGGMCLGSPPTVLVLDVA